MAAFPTHLCCWLTKMGPFLWPFLMALLPWIPLMSVGAVVALLVAVRMATQDPHPVVRVLPGEEAFVAFGEQSKEELLKWECNMFEEKGDERPGPKVDLSVVVPAYNEKDRLPAMLDQAIEFLQNPKFNTTAKTWEIIVVDDGSKDKTTETALEYAVTLGRDKMRVLTLAKNLGKGGAVRRGVRVARGETVMYADADGATTFSEINKVCSKLSEVTETVNGSTHGMVCGSRAHLEEESVASRSFFRTVLMYGFHACVRIFGGCRGVKDTQCGFKAMTRDTARLLFSNMHIERWAFDVELIRIAETSGVPVAEVAVEWTEIDGSKLDPATASVQMLKDLVMIWARYLTGAWRVRT